MRTVGDIVLERANALYQPLVDRYIAGENVPIDQLTPVWRNGLSIGPVADEPEIELFNAARKANRALPESRPKLRIICDEAAIDWAKIHTRDDLQPFVPNRDQNYTKIVIEQVLAKHQKALLYMGALHFRRTGGQPSVIEEQLQKAGAATYVILPGSNIVGSYDDLDSRFVQWQAPWILPIKDTWLDRLPAKPLLTGSNESHAFVSGTLADAADAFLFLGPRHELQQFLQKRSALDGTAYGTETERRLRIIFGERNKLSKFLPKDDSGLAQQYSPVRAVR